MLLGYLFFSNQIKTAATFTPAKAISAVQYIRSSPSVVIKSVRRTGIRGKYVLRIVEEGNASVVLSQTHAKMLSYSGFDKMRTDVCEDDENAGKGIAMLVKQMSSTCRL